MFAFGRVCFGFVLSLFAFINIAQAQVRPPVDLSGQWELDLGGTIEIHHLLSSGAVLARFSPSVRCHDDLRSTLFDTYLQVTPVRGGPPELTLRDGTFFACTRDKKLIDSCSGITAIWKSKFRDAKVSADGNTITAERFYEWLDYDREENGRYVNCRRNPAKDSWRSFTLTRACKADKTNKCRALARVMGAISRLIDTEFHTPTPTEWNQSVASLRPTIETELSKLRREFCDDADTQSKIDGMVAVLQTVGSGSAQAPSQVVAEQMIVARVDLDLKTIASTTCSASGSAPPPPSGICGAGTAAKQSGDNQAIDQVRKQIEDSIKEAVKMLENYEREAQGGAGTTAGQYADYYRTRVGQLKKLKGYWDMIRAASCLPPELAGLIRSVLGGRTDMCVDLCDETAKWIETWYPGPNGDIQKKAFLELCGFNCP